jgi:hypothetical protein
MVRRDGWVSYTDSAFLSIPKNLLFFNMVFQPSSKRFPEKEVTTTKPFHEDLSTM